ncbi:MAG TPA: DUF1080 domain-containing protein [Planctomycetaceae bacterium]|nr:DUF1080 domain-containing protein [Planctomycetaceae bacterium]
MSFITEQFVRAIKTFALLAVLAAPAVTCADDAAKNKDKNPTVKPTETPKPAEANSEPKWTALDIRAEGSWVQSLFGGDGEMEIADGVISLGFGDPLTGVRWEGDFPRQQYEISLEARRTAGFDFFCGMTVPVGKERCSLILGGWGGSLVGLSSIGGEDAAHNETMLIREFEQNRWYQVRMRVTQKRLQVWLDREQIIDFERDDRPLDIRAEMEQSTPLGIAAFQCESQIRNVRYRKIEDPDGKDAIEKK